VGKLYGILRKIGGKNPLTFNIISAVIERRIVTETVFMARLVAVVILFCLVEGCYTSTVRVESNPPGATVHYDYQPKGITPVEFPVEYLGTHKITLDHPEYGRREEYVNLDAPAYLWFPMDFIATIAPAKFKDRHSFTFDLIKAATSETEAQKDEPKGTEKQ
jgi:hypothetical protein